MHIVCVMKVDYYEEEAICLRLGKVCKHIALILMWLICQVMEKTKTIAHKKRKRLAIVIGNLLRK